MTPRIDADPVQATIDRPARTPNTRPGPHSWMDLGACLNKDPEVMFPDPSDKAGNAKAQAVCDRCAVLTECRAWALTTDGDHHGWVGGMSPKQSKQARRALTAQEAHRG